MPKIIRWIDYGKGFAIFLVIIGHVALGSLESQNFDGIDVVILRYILEATYAVHTPVFFALSGYFFKPIGRISMIGSRVLKRLTALMGCRYWI